MARDITYHSPGKAEENTPLVTILETNVEQKQSTAIDTRKSAYVIDLAKSSFGAVYYPTPGSQWYVKKIAGVWTLMSRAAQQNPQLNPGLTPAPGDTFLGGEGITYIVGDLNVGGSLTFGVGGPDPEIGCIKILAKASPPTGWLICDGSAISRTTYADLFTAIGTTFGVGDGSTTFNIPNVKGKVPVGVDAAQTEFDTLGETGGAKTVALITAELPVHLHAVGTLVDSNQTAAHTHSGTSGTVSSDHQHYVPNVVSTSGSGGGAFFESWPGGSGNRAHYTDGITANHTHDITTGTESANHNHTITGSTANTGSGTAHNNLQPYIALNFIIKAVPSSSGGGGGGASDLNGLTDVIITGPIVNQVLKYNGSQWVNSSSSGGATTLDGLTDVIITTPAPAQVLKYNGSEWANTLIIESDVTNLVSDLAAKQPLDSDLTTIAGLTATTDNFMQAKGSAWSSRTVAQVLTDLAVPGTTFQPLDADLTTIAALTATTDNFIQSKGSAWSSRTVAQVLTDLAAAGTTFQPLDSDLTTIAGLTATTDSFMQAKGSAWSARTVAQVLTDLAVPGTTFQPLDSDLTTIAGLTATTDNMIQSVGSAWASRTPTQVKAALAIAESDVTNLTTDLAAKQPMATLTTKGDVYVATGASTVVRLGVGIDNQVLTADSAQSSGVKWAAGAASSLLDAYIGEIRAWTTRTVPSADWMICDGSAISRTTYSALFNIIVPSLGTATMTIASPCVVSLTSHGLIAGDKIMFTTTGALPTGVSADTAYFVLAASLAANTFQFATTDGGAAINTTGSQSGVHTLRRVPFGVPNSSNFNIPNLKGRVPVGVDTTQTEFDIMGETGGAKTVTLTDTQLPDHVHGWNGSSLAASDTNDQPGRGAGAGDPNFRMQKELYASETYGSAQLTNGQAHNNLQPYMALNFIIRVLNGVGNTVLDSLNDVTITSVADKNVLQYDSGTSQWVNKVDLALATGVIDLTAAAVGTDEIKVKVTGDTQQRLIVNGNGVLEWGSGSATVDANLYRNGIGILKTDTALVVGTNFTVGSVQIDPTSAATGHILRHNGTKFVSLAEESVAMYPNVVASTHLGLSYSSNTVAFSSVSGASLSITKVKAGTKIVINMTGSLYVNTGGTGGADFGVLVNGVDNTCGFLRSNITSNAHLGFAGWVSISGLAAGAYTVQARIKPQDAGSTVNLDGGDFITLMAMEVK